MKNAKLNRASHFTELQNWYSKRDYSILVGMTVSDFIAELEARLDLYSFAVLCNGTCFTDPRWIKIYLGGGIALNINNSGTQGALETSGISIIKKEYLPLLVEACCLTESKSILHDIDKQENEGCTKLVEDYDKQMADEKFNVDFDQYMPKQPDENEVNLKKEMADFHTLLNKKNHTIANENNRYISEEKKFEIQSKAKDKYLLSMGYDEQKLVMTVDVKNFTQQELMEQFSHILSAACKTLCIDQTKPLLKTGKLRAINSFLSNYAIQYIDLLLYCLIEPKMPKNKDYVWQGEGDKNIELVRFKMLKLTEREIAELLNKDDLDVVDITRIKKDFYKPKLLNEEYMKRFIESIKSDPENLKERVSFKPKRQVKE